MAEVILNKDNFESEVLNSDIPVIVDFWAEWCGPCKKLGPIIAQIAEEKEGTVKVCKLNVDAEMALASKYNIQSIPTVMLFKGGEVVTTSVGLKSKDELISFFGI
ncbi:MAG: thioredoxin [Lachnospiraceae bacterium]|nr:thioredoxin [Lachnospiraceae bacterium]